MLTNFRTNVRTQIWDMFEDRHLFNPRNGNGEQCSEAHIAGMVAILGPPPPDFLGRSATSWKYFDENGTWKGQCQVPEDSLEMSEERLEGSDQVMFLNFIRKMLQWLPEKRSTASQLLDDPWLKL